MTDIGGGDRSEDRNDGIEKDPKKVGGRASMYRVYTISGGADLSLISYPTPLYEG